MNQKDLKLSILDLATIRKESTATDTLIESTEIAQLADTLGYTRYWFAEHHNITSQISTSPDLLTAHIGALTKRIRIGSGGIMLPNYSPLKVVENFALLEALHPKRIDLGIGRAPGTDSLTALALRGSNKAFTEGDFTNQMDELFGFFTHKFPENHPYQKIKATADPNLIPEIFMLGSSNGGVQTAIERGLGFVFAAQINPDFAIPILQIYHKRFKPSIYFSEPKGILSIIVIVAETDEEAEFLASPSILQWVRISTGRLGQTPTLEEAKNYQYTLHEENIKRETLKRFVIGSVDTVAQKLRELAKEAFVDEVMLFDMYPNKESRIKAYQLLAKEFNLNRE